MKYVTTVFVFKSINNSYQSDIDIFKRRWGKDPKVEPSIVRSRVPIYGKHVFSIYETCSYIHVSTKMCQRVIWQYWYFYFNSNPLTILFNMISAWYTTHRYFRKFLLTSSSDVDMGLLTVTKKILSILLSLFIRIILTVVNFLLYLTYRRTRILSGSFFLWRDNFYWLGHFVFTYSLL